MDETQPPTDVSDGEAEFMRPGEEDTDVFREENGEEFRFDNADQGELELWGSRRDGGK